MATNKTELKLEKRNVLGRKVKALRKTGVLPGNIFGKGVKSLSVQVDLKEFNQVYKDAGETGIITASVAKEAATRPLLISEIQVHPVTEEYLHVDFRQVDLTKKITANIPVEITGETPTASAGGVLIQILNEIEVEALPSDLPDKFTVDVSVLTEIGQALSLKDIKTGPKVTFTSEDLDELVVKIEAPAKEKEPEEEVAEEAEGEEAEGDVKEGEPKEGEAKEDKDKKTEEPKKDE